MRIPQIASPLRTTEGRAYIPKRVLRCASTRSSWSGPPDRVRRYRVGVLRKQKVNENRPIENAPDVESILSPYCPIAIDHI